ncbi:hypothetical protein TNCT_250831 [Trichonephila clavata]|uniref:Uncharacterized protein n=1 Tax=Trichonephila clavata TaxID=2740835 RepID=A0A8X6HD32_TRICU|nr:hypothetical protein TNCT_250831 [Trichonephila clavata]
MLNYSEMISRTNLSKVLKNGHIRSSYRVDCMADSLLKAPSFPSVMVAVQLRTPANPREIPMSDADPHPTKHARKNS